MTAGNAAPLSFFQLTPAPGKEFLTGKQQYYPKGTRKGYVTRSVHRPLRTVKVGVEAIRFLDKQTPLIEI